MNLPLVAFFVCFAIVFLIRPPIGLGMMGCSLV
jgi:hypothetical protein